MDYYSFLKLPEYHSAEASMARKEKHNANVIKRQTANFSVCFELLVIILIKYSFQTLDIILILHKVHKIPEKYISIILQKITKSKKK